MANDERDRNSGVGSGARDDESSSEESGHGGVKVGDTLKKLLTAGVSAAFMTEESIRGFVSELRLPKETLNLLLQGASKSKEELTNRVSKEIINMISKIDFVKEASRFVEEHKFRISAEIEVLRKDTAGDSGGASAGAGVGGAGTAGGSSVGRAGSSGSHAPDRADDRSHDRTDARSSNQNEIRIQTKTQSDRKKT